MLYKHSSTWKKGKSFKHFQRDWNSRIWEQYWLYHQRVLGWSSPVIFDCVHPFRFPKWFSCHQNPKHSVHWFYCVPSILNIGFWFCVFFKRISSVIWNLGFSFIWRDSWAFHLVNKIYITFANIEWEVWEKRKILDPNQFEGILLRH